MSVAKADAVKGARRLRIAEARQIKAIIRDNGWDPTAPPFT